MHNSVICRLLGISQGDFEQIRAMVRNDITNSLLEKAEVAHANRDYIERDKLQHVAAVVNQMYRTKE